MTESHYAVLPHGVNLEGWSEEDKEALDDHVRHMLHSKRSKFKQRMKAFGKYVSRRKDVLPLFVDGALTEYSSRILRHFVCHTHHIVRPGMGPFSDR